jgi:hypothetical protein
VLLRKSLTLTPTPLGANPRTTWKFAVPGARLGKARKRLNRSSTGGIRRNSCARRLACGFGKKNGKKNSFLPIRSRNVHENKGKMDKMSGEKWAILVQMTRE